MLKFKLFKSIGRFSKKHRKGCSALALALCIVGTGSVIHAVNYHGNTTSSPSELGLQLIEGSTVHNTGFKSLTYDDLDKTEIAYCLDPNKGSPNNTAYQTSGKLDSNQYNVLGWSYPSYHYTGCNAVDYFISQCAIWQSIGAINIDNCDVKISKTYYYNQDTRADYGDNSNSKWDSTAITAEYIKYYIQNLASVKEVPSTPTYAVSSGSTFNLYTSDPNYPDDIVSGWLSIEKTNDAWGSLQSVNVTLNCSANGAKLVKKGEEDKGGSSIQIKAGDKFYVSIPKSSVGENQEVTATINYSGNADGWYPAKVEPTTDSSKQPLAYITKGLQPINGTSASKLILDTPPESVGSIRIKKTDEDGNTLKGAEFTLTKPNGDTDKKETNSKGIVSWKQLDPGKYTVKETKAPEGYILNDKVYEAVIAKDGDGADLEIDLGTCVNKKKDTPKKATLKIAKIDADTNTALKGAKFELYKEDKTTKVKEGTTGDDGYLTFEDLDIGTYYFKEVEAPAGYLLDSKWVEVKFTDDADGLVKEIKVTNKKPDEKKPKGIEILKIDEDTNAPLAGAFFAIYKEDKSTEIMRGSTDTNGKVKFNNLENGTYYYKEILAPEGYQLDPNMYEFKIDDNSPETLSVTAKNKQTPPPTPPTTPPTTPGELWIYKSDVSTGELLPNATFFIYDSTGSTVVVSGITDENGLVKFQLEPGDYYYQEFSAPDGYEVDNTKFPFTIKGNGEIIKCKMTNVKQATPELPKTGDVDGLAQGTNIPMMCVGIGLLVLGIAYGAFIRYNHTDE